MDGARRLRVVLLASLVGLVSMSSGSACTRSSWRCASGSASGRGTSTGPPPKCPPSAERSSTGTGASWRSAWRPDRCSPTPGGSRIREEAARLLAPVIGRPREALLRDLRSDKSFVYLERFLDADEIERDPRAGASAGRRQPLRLGAGLRAGLSPGTAGRSRRRLRQHRRRRASRASRSRSTSSSRATRRSTCVLQDARNGRGARADPRSGEGAAGRRADHRLGPAARRRSASWTGRCARPAPAPPRRCCSTRPRARSWRWPTGRLPTSIGTARPRAPERVNRAVVHVYEPGSTFKIVTMAAALELGKVRPDQRIVLRERDATCCGRRTIHDISPHGFADRAARS